MKEIWKDIKGYEGYYQISNLGRVKSSKRNGNIKKKSILSLINCCGYKHIKLSKKNEIKTFLIHRLVAIAFIPNPENKPQVNHIDGNKKNNKRENLEWVTISENHKHAFRMGLKDNHRQYKYPLELLRRAILEFKRDSFHKSNAIELSKKYNINYKYLLAIIKKSKQESEANNDL